jgi:hypothetical protein
MKVMAKAKAKTQTNGKLEIKRLSPEELAEITTPSKYKTVEERRAALKRATNGPRFKTRITRDMYRPG